MVVEKEEEMVRKGPWTEQEDLQLVCFVGLFGERRWDFIAKVSGLNRTGKSCRLRWVNYLHPGLKRGRMSPQEERLVLELHSRWGNRWSRIARKLPGRTDNEIKNYWRTHMRKNAQEIRKRNSSPPPSYSSSSSSCCHASISSALRELPLIQDEIQKVETPPHGGGGADQSEVEAVKWYSIEQIWNDIASSEMSTLSYEECKGEACNLPSQVPTTTTTRMPSPPLWDSGSESLWRMNEEEELKMFLPITDDIFVSNYKHGKT